MQLLFARFWPARDDLRPEGTRRRSRFLSSHLTLAPPSFAILIFSLHCAFPAASQDARNAETQTFGRGVAITVAVHGPSGELISSPAMVKLFRGGTLPAGQVQTSRGLAELSVSDLGEFTVVVEAPGFPRTEKEFSVEANGRSLVDVYLRPRSQEAPPPGRPLLAPKAQKALDQALQSLGADRLSEADKHLKEAVRLAPGHPDVLYLQGVFLLKRRQWGKAQEVLEQATQLDPAHSQAWAALGMALCDQGKYGLAIAPLEKSFELNPPSSWEARWALAKAYYERARYAEALDMSEAALSASSGKAPEIGLLVAQSFTAVGRYEDAARALRDFLRDHSDRQEAATALKWLERLSSSGRIASK